MKLEWPTNSKFSCKLSFEEKDLELVIPVKDNRDYSKDEER